MPKVISRKVGEEIQIGDNIRVRVSSIRGRMIRLAVTAPEDTPIKFPPREPCAADMRVPVDYRDD